MIMQPSVINQLQSGFRLASSLLFSYLRFDSVIVERISIAFNARTDVKVIPISRERDKK